MSGHRVAVLGAGNSGFGLAADLAFKGADVCLFELPEFAQSIRTVLDQGGIKARGIIGEGFAAIKTITTNIREAVADAELVLISVPAVGHRRMAEACSSHLKAGQVVVLMPGNCGGALRFASTIREGSRNRDVIVAEAASFVFACKKEGPGGVWVRGLKKGLPVAAFPATHTTRVMELLLPLYPDMVAGANVLETSLQNNNHTVHPPAALLNVGRFEFQGGDWSFFLEGMGPSVCRLMEVIDGERMRICEAYGLPQIGLLEWMLRFYGHQGMKGATLHQALTTTTVHGASRAPSSVEHRYFTEDVPYGLVPMAHLADAAGVPVPNIKAMINVCGAVAGQDFWATGWDLQGLGLDGLSRAGILRYVTTGGVNPKVS